MIITLIIYILIGTYLAYSSFKISKEINYKIPKQRYITMITLWPLYLILGTVVPYVYGINNEDYLKHITKKSKKK